jgi:polar amino acid transport system substrate-binding protein
MWRNAIGMLAILSVGGLSVAAHAIDIKVFGDENYPPVIYRESAGQAGGVLPEVLRYVAKATGKPIELQLFPWKRSYTNAEMGLGGVIGVSKTDARMALFDFSEPIYEDNISVVVLRGHEFPFTGLADLKGKLIGTQLGASFGTEVDAAIDGGRIQVERELSHVSRMKKLLHGRIDAAFIGNGQVGLEGLIASDPELAANRDKFVALPTPLARDPLYLAFRKSMLMTSYLAEFNRALAEARSKHLLPGLAPLNKN